MILGVDAVIDCSGSGGGFQAGYHQNDRGLVEHVHISGFHIYNAVGGNSNGGYAGGIDAMNINHVSVLSSTFKNCTGVEAGAIAVHLPDARDESAVWDDEFTRSRTFKDLTIENCYGGVSNPREGGGAGSISVSYYSRMGSNIRNNHVLTNLAISGSSGGSNTFNGGAAGSISFSYHGGGMRGNSENTHTLSNLTISDSSGGSPLSDYGAIYGGAGGCISISYFSDGAFEGSNENNVHTLSNLNLTRSTGGMGTAAGSGGGGGGAAGSISISYKGNNNIHHNVHTLSNLQITDSYGGINAMYGGVAGAISISYHLSGGGGTAGGGDIENNVHFLSDVQIVDSSGGMVMAGGASRRAIPGVVLNGGAAGAISISYHISSMGAINSNIHTLSNVQISGSSGGMGTGGGGGAGAISISYHVSDGGNIENNVHFLSDVQIFDSSGGMDMAGGGSAGAISIAYYNSGEEGGSNIGNVHTLYNIQITGSSGGGVTRRASYLDQEGVMRTVPGGGAAGAISISYLTSCDFDRQCSNSNNVNALSNLQISDSSGGNSTTEGGAAGAVSVSYFNTNSNHRNTNNSNILLNSQITNSVGGTNTVGGGAGCFGISYSGINENNTHHISNTTLQGCKGGDLTQGGGALAVQSLGPTRGISVLIQDSVFASSQTISTKPEHSPITGVAGAVRIYTNGDILDTSSHVRIVGTAFRNNTLNTACTGGLCMAGALAVSAPTSLDRCTFDNNTCQRCSGAVYADYALELRTCTLSNNTASQVFFGTANLATLSAAVNTTMHFSGSNGGIVFSNLSSYDQLLLTCPAGEEIDNGTKGQYTCRQCSSGEFSLAGGQWLDAVRMPVCERCPEQDPGIVYCEGNSVKSQPGYYSYFTSASPRRADGYTTLAVAACPNRKACKNRGLVDVACETSLSVCNTDSSGKCAQGYTGLLCSQCNDDWFASKMNALDCKTCPPATLATVLAVAIGTGLYLVGIVLAHRGCTQLLQEEQEIGTVDCEPAQHTEEKRLNNRRHQLKQTRNPSLISASFKIMMAHATILSAIMGVGWEWQSETEDIMMLSTAPAGSVFEFDLSCSFGASFEENVYFSLTYPFVVVCIMFILAVILSKCSTTFENLGSTIWLFTTVGVYTFGAPVISDLFVPFPCFDGAGERMMVHDPSTKCEGHETLLTLSIVGISTYSVATAYVLGVAFWIRKDIIRFPSTHPSSVVESSYKAFSFLFYDYEPKYFYWEIIVFTRKLLVLITSIYLPPVTSMMTRTLTLAMIVFTCLVLQTRFRPYLLSTADTLDITTQSVSMLSIMLAQYVHATNIHSEYASARLVATVLFIGSNLVLILVHVRLVVAPLFDKLKSFMSSARNTGPAEPNDEEDGCKSESDQSKTCGVKADMMDDIDVFSLALDTKSPLDTKFLVFEIEEIGT